MSNGAYPIGSSLNQGQLGTMAGVGIPVQSAGFPDTGPISYDTSTLPSDYAVAQAYGQPLGISPYSNYLTGNAVVDNSGGSTQASNPTPAYTPYSPLTGGSTVSGVPVVQSPGLLQINPQTTGSGTGSGSGQNVQVGAQPGLLAAVDTFVNGIAAGLTNWASRGFLIVIGLVIAAIGILYLMKRG